MPHNPKHPIDVIKYIAVVKKMYVKLYYFGDGILVSIAGWGNQTDNSHRFQQLS